MKQVGWSSAVRVASADGLIFTSSILGLAEEPATTGPFGEELVAETCRAVYSELVDALGRKGSAAMLRLEHFPRSQSWLGVRQKVRGEFFGVPAQTCSFGVPAALPRHTLISVSGVAAEAPRTKRMLLRGAAYEMPHIYAAVATDRYALFSGVIPVGRLHEYSGDMLDLKRLENCGLRTINMIREAGLTAADVIQALVYAPPSMALETIENITSEAMGLRPQQVAVVHASDPTSRSLEIVTTGAASRTRRVIDTARKGEMRMIRNRNLCLFWGLRCPGTEAVPSTLNAAMGSLADWTHPASVSICRLDVSVHADSEISRLRSAVDAATKSWPKQPALVWSFPEVSATHPVIAIAGVAALNDEET